MSLNRPTFLGHIRNQITPTQVENVGQSGQLGEIGAYIKDSNGGHLFSHKFDDYGIVMVVTCIRPHRSYQQGIHFEDLKLYPEQFFKPVMNNLPYQPIYTMELWKDPVGATNVDPSTYEIFGWRPAWDEYQFFPDIKTGQFSSVLPADQNLDEWHYADYYTSKPLLSSSWLVQGLAEVDRTLSATAIGTNPICHHFMQENFIEIEGLAL